MGTIGATFIVIGIGLLYLMTGTLNIADMAHRLGPLRGTRPVLAALAFLTVGISLKLALFPLHQWLPNAYTYAPSAVSRLPRRDRDQGRRLRADALLLHGVRRRRRCSSALPMRKCCSCSRSPACSAPRRRDLPVRPQAPVRLFERRPDRLHHPRPGGRHRHRPDGIDRASVQPRDDEGRDLHAARRGDRASAA